MAVPYRGGDHAGTWNIQPAVPARHSKLLSQQLIVAESVNLPGTAAPVNGADGEAHAADRRGDCHQPWRGALPWPANRWVAGSQARTMAARPKSTAAPSRARIAPGTPPSRMLV